MKIIDGRCNVLFIITQLLRTEPSAIHKLTCSNDKCQGSPKLKYSPTIILEINHLKNVKDALLKYMISKSYGCTEETCDGIVNSHVFLQPHIFIEADVFSENQKFLLNEYPLELSIANER